MRQCVVSAPIPSIPTVTVERSRRKTCGSREYPAPPGLPVEMSVPGSRVADFDRCEISVATGRTKLGSLIGDHTKTALGVLLNTGSVIGVFSNLLPSGSLLPQIVPSFCQVQQGQLHERWDLRLLFTTAATAMSRRGQELTDLYRDLYFLLYDQTSNLRRKAIRATEVRRQRKNA